MPGSQIWDVMKRLPRLVQPSRCYPPLLLFHVGIDDIARGDPEHIKYDFMALDAMAMSMGAEWSSAGEGKVPEGEQMQPAGQQLQLVSIGIQLL